MKLFRCQVCDNIIYFENRTCGRCSHRLGYVPELEIMAALELAAGAWTPLAGDGGPRRFCDNEDHDACNWLIAAAGRDALRACRHNERSPTSASPRTRRVAQDRTGQAPPVLHAAALKLPLATRAEQSETGLAFDFLADQAEHGMKVMTGHDNGLITIALAEADTRSARGAAPLAEPYRTLLGHFRHEVGHHFWDLLVRDGGRAGGVPRAVRRRQAGLRGGAAAPLPAGCAGRLAGALRDGLRDDHPWEDFAETWAHYLHIVDTLETASAFGS